MSIEDKKELRTIGLEDIELRVTDDKQPRLTGYAARYNSFTDLGWFRERIKAGAFDDALKTSDVRCLKNHDPNLILGRTKNETLRLESNTLGLKFDNDIPDTTTGKDTLAEVKRGDISGCSFAFTVAEDDWKYFDDDRPSERTIVKIGQLFDVGPVTYPAYPDTSVAARSLERVRAETEEEKPQEIDRERQLEVERNYRKAGRIINRNKSADV